MRCACGEIHAGLALSSALMLLKAKQVVPEYEDMEASQEAIAQASYAEWSQCALASALAAEAALPSARPVSGSDLVAVRAALSYGFGGWPSAGLRKLFANAVDEFYKLSQRVIFNKRAKIKGYSVDLVLKAELLPSFNVADQAAIDYLSNSQVFWLLNHYDATTKAAIDAAALEDLLGLTGSEAGKVLKERVDAIFGVGAFAAQGEEYFKGVAVNAATTSRVMGSIREMGHLGIEKYVINNPMDERTSDICSALDGKEFPVADQLLRIDQIVAAGDPEAVKSLHPWSPNDFADVFAELGVTVEPGKPLLPGAAEVLSAAGYGMPPYHMKCRTTVDIA